jgi:prepilin-type N-terminal cleavage/methylation domain-containing protein
MKQGGFTLLELLIALAIGSLCSILAVQLFIGFHKQSELSRAYLNLTSKALFAKTLLSSNLSRAGLLICQKSFSTIAIDGSSIRFEATTKENSIVTAINKNKITVAGLTPKFKKGQRVVFSNCVTSLITTLKKVSTSKTKQQQILTVSADKVLEVRANYLAAPLQTIKFSIGKSKVEKGSNALFLKTKRNYEVLPGVQSMLVKRLGDLGLIINLELQSEKAVLPDKKHLQLPFNFFVKFSN